MNKYGYIMYIKINILNEGKKNNDGVCFNYII
jgi:hypothetical protein